MQSATAIPGGRPDGPRDRPDEEQPASRAGLGTAIRADGLRLGATDLDLLHDLMAEAIRLDAHHAVVDDAVTAWLTARGRFAGA